MHTAESIAARLSEIAALDPDGSLFGASRHGHRQNPPASEDDVAAFEGAHDLPLPSGYRAYLLTVADGGAGPFYGLYSLDEAVAVGAQLSGSADALSARFPVDAAALAAWVANRRAKLDDGDDDEIEYLSRPSPCPGLLALAEYGCGAFYALVVRGELAGTVWFVDEDRLVPVLDDQDRPVAFLDWLGDEVDAQLDVVRPGWRPPRPAPPSNILSWDGHWSVTELPPEALANPRLKKLVLSRTGLTRFPTAVTALTELRTLDLSMTKVTELPPDVGRMTSLRKLRFAYATWDTLPDELDRLTDLEELSIYYAYTVKALPDVVARLPNLRRLLASHSSALARLPDGFGALARLETLTLESTALEQLPDSFGDLASLRHLTLGGTKLTRLPTSFARLGALESLNLACEDLDLEQAVAVLAELPNLRSLTLPMAERWPKAVAGLRVTHLKVAQNYTLWRAGRTRMPVPAEIGLFPALEKLDLTNVNQAASLPDSIGDLATLRELQLMSTAIRDVPPTLRKLRLELVQAMLAQGPNTDFGLSPAVKDRLATWFPNAKLWIW